MSDRERLLGLKALLEAAVEHGSRAIERVHQETATRTFDILEAVPPVAPVAKVVRVVHDGVLESVHAGVRLANHGVHRVADAVIKEVAPAEEEPPKTDGPTE